MEVLHGCQLARSVPRDGAELQPDARRLLEGVLRVERDVFLVEAIDQRVRAQLVLTVHDRVGVVVASRLGAAHAAEQPVRQRTVDEAVAVLQAEHELDRRVLQRAVPTRHPHRASANVHVVLREQRHVHLRERVRHRRVPAVVVRHVEQPVEHAALRVPEVGRLVRHRVELRLVRVVAAPHPHVRAPRPVLVVDERRLQREEHVRIIRRRLQRHVEVRVEKVLRRVEDRLDRVRHHREVAVGHRADGHNLGDRLARLRVQRECGGVQQQREGLDQDPADVLDDHRPRVARPPELAVPLRHAVAVVPVGHIARALIAVKHRAEVAQHVELVGAVLRVGEEERARAVPHREVRLGDGRVRPQRAVLLRAVELHAERHIDKVDEDAGARSALLRDVAGAVALGHVALQVQDEGALAPDLRRADVRGRRHHRPRLRRAQQAAERATCARRRS